MKINKLITTILTIFNNYISKYERNLAFHKSLQFISRQKIKGDLVEFGVWKGRSIAIIQKYANKLNLNKKIWAFDCFEGLPYSEGEFNKNQYKGDYNKFKNKFKNITTIKGYFKDTLKMGNKPNKIALAHIDADLYESIKDILVNITPLLTKGTILLFDDFYCYSGQLNCGGAKALSESKLNIRPWFQYSIYGQSFIVQKEIED